MKKILSVLLAMTMVFTCCSVAFGAFAADAETQAAIDKLNKAIETAVTVEVDKNGNVTRHTAGYNFGVDLPSLDGMVAVDGDYNNYLKDILANYPDYAGLTYVEDSVTYPAFGKVATKMLAGCVAGMNFTSNSMDKFDDEYNMAAAKLAGSVRKNSVGADTLGENALDVMKINADTVASVSDSAICFNDIDLVAGDKVAGTIIETFAAKSVVDLTGFYKGFTKAAKESGIKLDDFVCKYTDIVLTTNYDGDNLSAVALSYTINVSATMKLLGEVITLTVTPFTVTTAYTDFNYYDEANDFDFAELAAKINEGTAYAVDRKGGYDYTRLAAWDNNDSFTFTLGEIIVGDGTDNPDQLSIVNLLSGEVLNMLLGAFDKVTIKIDQIFGTGITTWKWTPCDGCLQSCTICQNTAAAEGTHKEHTCVDGWGTEIAGCTCGYKVEEHQTEIDVLGEKISVKTVLEFALDKIQSALFDSSHSAFEELLGMGAYTANVPTGTDANEVVKKGTSLKKTELTVNDIEDVTVNADGSLTLEIPGEIYTEVPGFPKTEVSALSHITDDMFTLDEYVKTVSKLGLLKTLGDKIEVTPFNTMVGFYGTGSGSSGAGEAMGFPNIQVNVKFVDATPDNIYGTGEVESIDYMYYVMAVSQFAIAVDALGNPGIIESQAGAHIATSYADFDYFDYEKGDVDMSTKVSIVDAKLVLKSVVGSVELNDYQKFLADMDNNNAVDIRDAKKILQKVANQAV